MDVIFIYRGCKDFDYSPGLAFHQDITQSFCSSSMLTSMRSSKGEGLLPGNNCGEGVKVLTQSNMEGA